MDTCRSLGLTQTDWLCLSFLSGIGPSRLSRLYTYLSQLHLVEETVTNEKKLSDTSSLFETEESDAISLELLKALKWPDVTAHQAMEYLLNGTLTKEQEAKREQSLAWLAEPNHHVVLQDDEYYPEALKEISVAPAFLYIEGELASLMLPKIGIVGARKCTQYGHDVTFRFAEQLSAHGVCVVSGGAIGIDTSAHLGALHNKTTPTIAVMGTGLLHRYPNKNTLMFKQILDQGGALISEYPLMTTPRPHLFPPRNRIISGLSMGVLVAEASIKSGSLISASYAVQQNREVFAVPGRLSDSQSEGCHQLLRQGATLVRNVEDILLECSAMLDSSHIISSLQETSFSSEKGSSVSKKNIKIPLSETKSIMKIDSVIPLPDFVSREAMTLANLLEKEVLPMDFDALIRSTNMDAGTMMQVLMELQLCECVENHEGLYRRC